MSRVTNSPAEVNSHVHRHEVGWNYFDNSCIQPCPTNTNFTPKRGCPTKITMLDKSCQLVKGLADKPWLWSTYYINPNMMILWSNLHHDVTVEPLDAVGLVKPTTKSLENLSFLLLCICGDLHHHNTDAQTISPVEWLIKSIAKSWKNHC